MRCANWYHLHHLKLVKNIHGGVLILILKVCTNDNKSRKPKFYHTYCKLLVKSLLGAKSIALKQPFHRNQRHEYFIETYLE